MSKWQAIVFDLDDTLYPERDFVLSGFEAVAQWAETHLAIPAEQGFAELRGLFMQGVRGDTFDRWLSSHDRSADLWVQQLVQVYRDHDPVLRPFPEVPRLLEALHERYRLGLVSDGTLSVQRRKLAALGLGDLLDAVVFSDEWGREAWKPNPKPFEVIAERLGVELDRTVYVGDNPAKDFLGARQVRMYTVWLQRPDGEYSHLTPETADHAPHGTIVALTELETLLESHGL